MLRNPFNRTIFHILWCYFPLILILNNFLYVATLFYQIDIFKLLKKKKKTESGYITYLSLNWLAERKTSQLVILLHCTWIISILYGYVHSLRSKMVCRQFTYFLWIHQKIISENLNSSFKTIKMEWSVIHGNTGGFSLFAQCCRGKFLLYYFQPFRNWLEII